MDDETGVLYNPLPVERAVVADDDRAVFLSQSSRSILHGSPDSFSSAYGCEEKVEPGRRTQKNLPGVYTRGA